MKRRSSEVEESESDDSKRSEEAEEKSCGASALTGALSLMLDVPQRSVLEHVAPHFAARVTGRIEELAQAQAAQLDNIDSLGLEALGHVDVAHPPEPPPPSRQSSSSSLPVPELPSFGLGLKRQKSMTPPSLLTEAEASENTAALHRCAAALKRLVRSSGAVAAPE